VQVRVVESPRPVSESPRPDHWRNLQDVVSPSEPAPRGATRNERAVSMAAFNQLRYWACCRQIAGDGEGWASSCLPGRADQRSESLSTRFRGSIPCALYRIDLGLPAGMDQGSMPNRIPQ
jgi:hypothetical protein